MRRWAPISAAVLFLLLATVGLLRQQPDRHLTPTSYGTSPRGYKAVHDLLQESGVGVERSLERLSAVPTTSTIWFIDPQHLCGAADAESEPEDGRDWLRSGGTAVVLLSAAQGCAAIGGEVLPDRPGAAADPASARGASADTGDGQADAPASIALAGVRLPRPRLLPAADLRLFAAPAEWTIGAAAEDGRAFLLERAVGAGRLVVVADSRFLSNQGLAEYDAAPLAMDLVRAYGAPLIDERDHGFRSAGGGVRWRGFAPALPLFAALATIGLAFVWWGAALPPPLARRSEPPAPTLSSYVQSLATLYSRSRDFAGACGRYRAYAVGQLRRRLTLPADAPLEAVIARLARLESFSPADLALLRQSPAVASEEELRRHAGALDDIIRKATR